MNWWLNWINSFYSVISKLLWALIALFNKSHLFKCRFQTKLFIFVFYSSVCVIFIVKRFVLFCCFSWRAIFSFIKEIFTVRNYRKKKKKLIKQPRAKKQQRLSFDVVICWMRISKKRSDITKKQKKIYEQTKEVRKANTVWLWCDTIILCLIKFVRQLTSVHVHGWMEYIQFFSMLVLLCSLHNIFREMRSVEHISALCRIRYQKEMRTVIRWGILS